ncbi:MAG: hypothetical protein ABSG11_24515 [Candidatus Korobacteraceae bacterium]|jgi:hypothetical protein
MPINAPRRLLGRKQVGWFGIAPPADGRKAFEDRGFLVTTCSDADLRNPAYLSGLSAVVFNQSAEKALQIVPSLQNHAQRLLNYDCLVILRPGSKELSDDPSIITNAIVKLHLWAAGLPPKEEAKLKWQAPMDGIPALPHAAFFGFAVPWLDIANTLADNPSGAAPNLALKPTVDDVVKKLDPDAEILIQRAFWDCAEVHLVAMADGHSGARVYRAYAELTEGLHGRWPQPYFVKIGDRGKIFSEYKVYEERVDPYIPFHLGPHLIRERCCLGASVGLIVGDYVEESESLRDCASQGRAATAISCLFDRTLLGWYRSAHKVDTSLAAGLANSFPRQHKISSDRFARARALGATLNLSELRSLFERCDKGPVLVGPIHRDLHAANVRVRATDAIVIDFYAHRDFPLVYDAACLEASLLVEGFADDKRDIEEWLLSLTPLYDNPLLDGTLPHPNPKDRSCWFHACIRQIRRYAHQWQCCDHQYAAALAVALLTKAVKDKDAPEPEFSRRAAAYVLAERVLQSAFGGQAAAAPAAVKAS